MIPRHFRTKVLTEGRSADPIKVEGTIIMDYLLVIDRIECNRHMGSELTNYLFSNLDMYDDLICVMA